MTSSSYEQRREDDVEATPLPSAPCFYGRLGVSMDSTNIVDSAPQAPKFADFYARKQQKKLKYWCAQIAEIGPDFERSAQRPRL